MRRIPCIMSIYDSYWPCECTFDHNRTNKRQRDEGNYMPTALLRPYF